MNNHKIHKTIPTESGSFVISFVHVWFSLDEDVPDQEKVKCRGFWYVGDIDILKREYPGGKAEKITALEYVYLANTIKSELTKMNQNPPEKEISMDFFLSQSFVTHDNLL